MKANEAPEKIYLQPMPNPSDGYVGVAWSDPYCDAKEYTLTDAFIDKACGWLKEQDEMVGISFEEDFIERFKKYMKGE